ncbi:MAG TPA: glycosyltransferase family 39 protein, partial [Nitrosopumilaceae archaeon]|nr:glycosyltransferase family 39 protein [Nitrosopumilaceae archaeon]
MVARNFYEVNPDILYPRIDFAGNKSGVTGMEFPVLNYIIYLISLPFGYSHWYGRLINLFISSLGIFFFFKIIKKYFDKDLAFYSSLILLCSFWFAYSRKIMPDTFSMSLTLIGFYFGTDYLDTSKKRIFNLLLYFLFTFLGVMSKLPSGYILILFLFFFANKEINLTSKIVFSVATLLFIIPIGLWYFYWVPYLVETYGFWHFFMGKSMSQGFIEICGNINDTLSHFYDAALKYIGFCVFIFGLCMSCLLKKKTLLLVFLLSFFAFLFVTFKAGATFSHHAYYIIPFVPVMALICGYGITKIANSRIAIVILTAIMIEGIINQQDDFFLRENEIAIVSLESTLDKFSDRKDLIVINSNENPTP